jgi:hypothetical protein
MNVNNSDEIRSIAMRGLNFDETVSRCPVLLARHCLPAVAG